MTASLTASMSPAEREQLVARISAEVVRRLSVPPPQASTAVSASQPSATATATEAAGTGPMLAEKVIVLATVARLPRDLREVTVRQDAVLTPSAREWLADHRIAIRRVAAVAASATPAASPAFLVAASDLPARAAGQAAAVARAVPGGQQLPATGLASLIDAFAEAASRNGSRGLLLTPRPAAAALMANRKRTIRAVVATSVREALAVAEECRATLVVLDPSRLGPGSLQRVAIEFAKQSHQPLPADLAEACRPCGCSRSPQEATR